MKGLAMSAEAAIGAGMINQAAADYVAGLQGTDKPAPHIRQDHQRPPEEENNKTPAQACIEALGAFFTSPTATSKAVAMGALEAHLVASGGIAAEA